MEFIDNEAESCVVNRVLEIKIEDFSTAFEMVGGEYRSPHSFLESIYAAVYPDGVDDDTEGWLVVLADVDIKTGRIPENDVLSWIVSVIDNKGNPTLPRSFERHHDDFQHEKYLKRSFILDQADELLDEDALTLRCDIYYNWYGNKDILVGCTNENAKRKKERVQELNNFLRSIQKVRKVNGSESGEPIGASTVYDFTHQILTLPEFHELRRKFGVYGISPSFSWPSAGSKQKNKEYIMEHAWVFDTHPDRFLLLLDERVDNVGARLLKASSFIRQCVHTPMKERRDKRVKLPDVDSQTFRAILFFLEKGYLPPSEFNELVHVYKLSHLWGMKELQERCSELMVKSLEFPTDFEELERLAFLCSDDHLSTLLDIGCEEDVYPLLFGRRSNVVDRLDSASFV